MVRCIENIDISFRCGYIESHHIGRLNIDANKEYSYETIKFIYRLLYRYLAIGHARYFAYDI